MLTRNDSDKRELSRMNPRDRALVLGIRGEKQVRNDPYNSRVRKTEIERSASERSAEEAQATFNEAKIGVRG